MWFLRESGSAGDEIGRVSDSARRAKGADRILGVTENETIDRARDGGEHAPDAKVLRGLAASALGNVREVALLHV